jgi:hypothetical protein
MKVLQQNKIIKTINFFSSRLNFISEKKLNKKIYVFIL